MIGQRIGISMAFVVLVLMARTGMTHAGPDFTERKDVRLEPPTAAVQASVEPAADGPMADPVESARSSRRRGLRPSNRQTAHALLGGRIRPGGRTASN